MFDKYGSVFEFWLIFSDSGWIFRRSRVNFMKKLFGRRNTGEFWASPCKTNELHNSAAHVKRFKIVIESQKSVLRQTKTGRQERMVKPHRQKEPDSASVEVLRDLAGRDEPQPRAVYFDLSGTSDHGGVVGGRRYPPKNCFFGAIFRQISGKWICKFLQIIISVIM